MYWVQVIGHFSTLTPEINLSKTYVDLIVIHLSCSSFLVSVALVSPALAEAMIPALDKSESVSVDLPWSTWAITDMFRILCFLSIMVRISSTVKFTLEKKVKKLQFRTFYHKMWNLLKVISGEICFLSSFFRTGLWIFIINIAKIKEKVEIFYLKLFTIKRNLNQIDKSSRNSN